MKNHITKAIAVMMAVFMLVGTVPSSVLPVFALGSDSAAQNNASSSIFDNVTLGKGTVINTENYGAGARVDSANNAIVDNTLSPYEPYSTMDETHPFLPGNEAWMDLSKIYYGAPATPNTPITKWSANTSVVNITGTGTKYGSGNGVVSGTEIYAMPDMNLIDEYLWADGTRVIGGVSENGVATTTDSKTGTFEFYAVSGEDHIFYDATSNDVLPFEYVPKDIAGNINGLDAANEIEYKGTDIVIVSSYVDLKTGTKTYKNEDGTTTTKDVTFYYYKTTNAYNTVTKKDGSDSAYVYNRYDAMQGKWGLTLDKNVSTVVWAPSYAKDYYGTGKAMNNSILYLSDTPYLFYSTEAPDTTKMAISLLIGVQTQNELRTDAETNLGQTTVTQNSQDYWEYRWYTITDNALRPGIDPTPSDNKNETLDYSMVPNVYKSGTVAQDVNQNTMGDVQTIIAAIKAHNKDAMDPFAVAAAEGKNTEEMYVSGSITGCIDFTQLLPTLMGNMVDGTNHDSGREDIKYKIVQVRVDTKTADGEKDSAARINYMYFGPGQAAVYTPQSTEGQEVIGANWMWAQNEHGFGDGNSNNVAKGDDAYFFGSKTGFGDFDSGYTNGWENGMAVSITNTPNDPQKMTIDTYGTGNGQLITYDDYYNEMRAAGMGEWESHFTKGSIDVDEFDADGNVIVHPTYGVQQLGARIWKYTDVNGNTQYLEAEYNDVDGQYYIMVSVPIRKWVNVLGDSRKISFTINVEKYGLTATYDATGTSYTTTTNDLDPTFCMWGNSRGSLGAGHSKVRYGARFRSEDMLAVFGDGYYHVDCSDNYHSAEIDKTLGNSLFYDGTDCWFDILRSPYVYDHTVTNANDQCNYGSEMIGYTYVTTIRYAVPIGCKFSVQNMKGDGNSAGLNSYSATGNIVQAFDGGTGVQPEIIVDNALTEYKTEVAGDATTGYTYTVSNNGTVNGTQSSGAAAYGPMLRQSYYTIYDMLDTELINALDKDSHHINNTGKGQMTVYGQMWSSFGSTQLPVHYKPDATTQIYGYTYSSVSEFPIYAIVKISDESNEKWGLTGVVTTGGTPEVGWVCLWDAGDDDQTDIAGQSGNNAVKAENKGGVIFKEYTATRAEACTDSFRNNILKEMNNEWLLSNFVGQYSDFQGSTKNSFKYGILSGTSYSAKPNDIYSSNYDCTLPMFANMWRDESNGANVGVNLKDTTLTAANNTEMQFGLKRKNNTDKNWSIGVTRTFDTPITLHSNKIHGSYPVLYYDYTVADWSDGSDSNAFALSLLVDGESYLYYFDGEGSSATKGLVTEWKDGADGSVYGYFNFKDIMTNTFPGKTVQVVSISFNFWRAGSANINEDTMTIRRMEIWQEETDWLDEIISADSSMTSHVYDSMNIINDAYFHVHNEDNDGGYTISRVNNDDGTGASYDRTNIGINEQLSGYKFTETENNKSETVMLKPAQTLGTANGGTLQMEIQRTVSYRKTNSNKGWSARISTDTNLDGIINEKDTTYYSKNFDSETSTGVENVYEYRTALGHLRVWVPAGKQASVVFEADRSFNVDNYKYLYYSYSMRDVESGISAEDKSTDGKGSGITMAIKSQQNTSDKAYLETDGTWMYFPDDTPYWSDQGHEDRRRFSTTMNAALDLSTLEIDSINQLVFYLNNAKKADPDDPMANRAEFYINYIYLSNVPPTDLIENELEQTQMQYYYLMDNTGDRYSARFPTIDNPTGQVTGDNSDNDRVNPVKVVRGQYLSAGTYFNGDPIYGYGTTELGTTLDKTTGSLGKYEKTYGATDGYENSMKNIMFYAGESDDLDDINDYYKYKDTDNDGKATIYDMFWSYGRWYQSSGDTGMNIMYVGDPNAPDNEKADPNYRYDAISGALTRRYATENYVLLRAGIEPKTFKTYFDANGGEFLYDVSSETVSNLQEVSEQSYYITDNVILSYFQQPYLLEAMKGDTKSYEDMDSFLKKPGYKFSHWEHYTYDGVVDNNFNVVNGVSTSPDQNGARFMTFIKKTGATSDYFKAVWEKDTDNYPADKKATATFMNTNGTDTWKTIEVGNETSTVDDANGRFVLTFPGEMVLTNGKLKTRIYGWKTEGSDKVFNPGDKIYLLEDTEFIPVTNQSEGNTFSITLENAKLYVRTDNGITNPVEKHGASVSVVGNVYTYSYVQQNYNLVALPLEATDGYGWFVKGEPGSETVKQLVNTTTVLSDNKEAYCFTAHENISIVYDTISWVADDAFYQDQPIAFSTISTGQTKEDLSSKATVYFTSQFEIVDENNSADIEILAYGTMYTKDTYFDKYTAAEKDSKFRLDMDTVSADTITKKSYKTVDSTGIKWVESTITSSNYEYTMRLNHTSTKDPEATYYARTYVIYKLNGTIYVAYSNIAAYAFAQSNAA